MNITIFPAPFIRGQMLCREARKGVEKSAEHYFHYREAGHHVTVLAIAGRKDDVSFAKKIKLELLFHGICEKHIVARDAGGFDTDNDTRTVMLWLRDHPEQELLEVINKWWHMPRTRLLLRFWWSRTIPKVRQTNVRQISIASFRPVWILREFVAIAHNAVRLAWRQWRRQ